MKRQFVYGDGKLCDEASSFQVMEGADALGPVTC